MSDPPTNSEPEPTGVGANQQGFFGGVVDEVRIWNYARSDAQILSGYSREIPTAFGLIGRWAFNDCCGAVTDSSGRPSVRSVLPRLFSASG